MTNYIFWNFLSVRPSTKIGRQKFWKMKIFEFRPETFTKVCFIKFWEFDVPTTNPHPRYQPSATNFGSRAPIASRPGAFERSRRDEQLCGRKLSRPINRLAARAKRVIFSNIVVFSPSSVVWTKVWFGWFPCELGVEPGLVWKLFMNWIDCRKPLVNPMSLSKVIGESVF